MKLNKTQKEFLHSRSIVPSIQPDIWPKWMTNLWNEYLIEAVGNSIYLTDLGFRTISEENNNG